MLGPLALELLAPVDDCVEPPEEGAVLLLVWLSRDRESRCELAELSFPILPLLRPKKVRASVFAFLLCSARKARVRFASAEC